MASLAESLDVLLEQQTFINNLAPYYRLAKSCNEDDDFFERLCDLWFIRWRLRLQDYGGSLGSLNDGIRCKKEWIKDELHLAASLAPEAFLERSWQSYMTICERRQGVSAIKRKFRDCDGHDDAHRPRPRPRPKKIRTNPDNVIDKASK